MDEVIPKTTQRTQQLLLLKKPKQIPKVKQEEKAFQIISIKPKVKEVQKLSSQPRTLQESQKLPSLGLLKSKQQILLKQSQQERQIFKQKEPTQKVVQFQKSFSGLKSLSSFRTKQSFAQPQAIKEALKTPQLFKQSFTQPQLFKQQERQLQRFGTPFIQKLIPEEPRVPTLLFPSKQKKEPKVSEDLFGVEIRRRGKFRSIGKKLSLKQALAAGRERVATTLGATFRITGKGVDRLATPKGFRRKNGLFIEQRKFRLSTGREVGEIQIAKKIKKKRRKN